MVPYKKNRTLHLKHVWTPCFIHAGMSSSRLLYIDQPPQGDDENQDDTKMKRLFWEVLSISSAILFAIGITIDIAIGFIFLLFFTLGEVNPQGRNKIEK